MKKVVITGATSMLGVALVKECIKNGVEVIAIVRKKSNNLDRLPISNLISIVESDLSELLSIDDNLCEECDVFYHFAWDFTYRNKRDNAVCQETNIKYTLDAVELAKKMNCKMFVGAGSQAEYGRMSDAISPDTSVNPDISYGIAKYAAGKLSRIQCLDYGIKHVWTRIFSVYGPYDGKETMIMYTIKSLLNDEKPIFTKAEQVWDYLYCNDAAKAFYLIGLNGKDGAVYCIGSGQTKILKEYIEIIKNKINPNLPVGFGEKEYAKNQVMYLCADITNLTEDTGWIPEYTFEDGIQDTINWIKEES